jgi:hypothetical protein
MLAKLYETQSSKAILDGFFGHALVKVNDIRAADGGDPGARYQKNKFIRDSDITSMKTQRTSVHARRRRRRRRVRLAH